MYRNLWATSTNQEIKRKKKLLGWFCMKLKRILTYNIYQVNVDALERKLNSTKQSQEYCWQGINNISENILQYYYNLSFKFNNRWSNKRTLYFTENKYRIYICRLRLLVLN